MAQFYAQAGDEGRCHQSSMTRKSITVTGVDSTGRLWAFIGIVQSVEAGHSVFAGYPLRVTMPDAEVRYPP
jgi:hypothetical protein